MALLLVSHDLGLVAGLADRVAIAYAGHVVECAPVDRLFSAPQHPYTRGLLRAVPDIETGAGRFVSIPGAVPHPAEVPPYCRFQPRCTHRIDVCERQDPAPRAVQPEHLVACWVDIEPTEPWAQPGGRS